MPLKLKVLKVLYSYYVFFGHNHFFLRLICSKNREGCVFYNYSERRVIKFFMCLFENNSIMKINIIFRNYPKLLMMWNTWKGGYYETYQHFEMSAFK